VNIGVDIRTLSSRRGGISQYTYNLLKNVLRIDNKNKYFLFNYNKSPYEWDNLKGNVEEIILRLPQRCNLSAVWENVFVPITVKRMKIDLWFSPDFSIPKFLRIPSVVTVHDVIFKKYHDVNSNKSLQTMAKKVRFSVTQAQKIIVNSKFTLNEVLNEYEIEDDKVYVTYLAADERFHQITDKNLLSKVLNRYDINFQYILFVGEISNRKNLIRLLQSYDLLKKRNKILEQKLLLVGKRTTETDNVFEEVTKLDLISDVVFTGYVPDEDLPFLYNGADLFVFPSLYEGFGIPILEAMSCQIPVVASNVTSIPEVAGDGALLCDPYNIDDIADKIDQIVNKRIDIDKLNKKAMLQASKFSWVKTARETIDILELAGCSLCELKNS
jgi:glycosyltransferase involved in cell wall biosynthesis